MFHSQFEFFFLLIPVPPDILDYPTSGDQIVPEGGNLSLQCAAKGTPHPTITWKRESGDYIHHGQEKG